MSFTIRPFVHADGPMVAEILSRTDPEPVTAAEVIEWETSFPATMDGAFQLRLTATLPDGKIVGWGVATRKPWLKPGKFHLHAVTDPEFRRQGIGGALMDALERFAMEHGGFLLETDVRDNDPAELAFVERRGYKTELHTFESVLDLASFDDTPFLDAVAQVEREFRFFTLAEEPGLVNERKLYDLRVINVAGLPGYDGSGAPAFEQWREERLYRSDARHDLIIIAADGDRFAGETQMTWNEQTQSMYTAFTGVHPDYRGRHLALALKVHAARLARKTGAVYMRTNNDEQNGPMLAVNRKLGYRPEPGCYVVIKRIEE